MRLLACAVLPLLIVGCPSLSSDWPVVIGARGSRNTSGTSPGSVDAGPAPGDPVGDAAPPTPPPDDGGLTDGGDAAVAWSPPVVPTSSPGCGTGTDTIAAGETHSVLTGRTYHVWGPPGYDRATTWPVVVMFHGIETNGAEFEDWFRMEDFVEGKAIVVYPDAANGYWDVSGTSDLAFFDALMKDLGGRYCIDPSRVLGFGFSWGAYFASWLGCMRAGWVKAISAGDGGWGGPHGHACGRLPVLVTHRTADNDESVQNGRSNAARWKQLNGCTGAPVVTDVAMNCTSQTDCLAPGAVTYCEDTWFDPSWPADWNHTVREPYCAYTWSWFDALP